MIKLSYVYSIKVSGTEFGINYKLKKLLDDLYEITEYNWKSGGILLIAK